MRSCGPPDVRPLHLVGVRLKSTVPTALSAVVGLAGGAGSRSPLHQRCTRAHAGRATPLPPYRTRPSSNLQDHLLRAVSLAHEPPSGLGVSLSSRAYRVQIPLTPNTSRPSRDLPYLSYLSCSSISGLPCCAQPNARANRSLRRSRRGSAELEGAVQRIGWPEALRLWRGR